MIHAFIYKLPVKRIFYLFLPVVVLSCTSSAEKKKVGSSDKYSQQDDLRHIRESGVLRAVVDYNSTNYFVYRGKPMGFKYELLQELSKELGVKLQIVVSNNLAETFDGLINNQYDLVAKSLTVTKRRSQQIDFTVPLMETRQVLVQRAKSQTNDSMYITSALELAGKMVHVQKSTSYYRRLVNLSDEIGADIDIVEDTIYGVEQLVERVAEGEIDYTVCDENVARLNQMYYPNLDVSLKISLPQYIAWGVRNGSTEWKNYLDKWITKFKKTRKFRRIYYRYFESPRVAVRMESDYHSISGGKISGYDDIVKQVSEEYDWDWRLISAIIYQESRFNKDAGSWAGAYGLMQLMPSTAESLGIDNYKKPKQNIKGGVLLLNWLNDQFLESIPDSTERIKFVLAAYNIGLGHVKDAQRLARKYGKDGTVWENNVDFFLRNKSAEKYYKDPVVRWGYCRGKEAYNYVNNVITNYKHYRNVIPVASFLHSFPLIPEYHKIQTKS